MSAWGDTEADIVLRLRTFAAGNNHRPLLRDMYSLAADEIQKLRAELSALTTRLTTYRTALEEVRDDEWTHAQVSSYGWHAWIEDLKEIAHRALEPPAQPKRRRQQNEEQHDSPSDARLGLASPGLRCEVGAASRRSARNMTPAQLQPEEEQ